jgi:shikimate dehydrogenase
MKRLAVVGSPVAHSLSPVIFNSISLGNNINSHYTRVCGNSFQEIVKLLEILDIDAFNITSPFKENAFKYADETCIDSKQTSSSNLIIRNNGLKAFNTDFFAITNIIKKITLEKNCNVLILGAGDTARTTINALEKLEFLNISVAVRNTQSHALKYLKNSVNILDIRNISSFRNFDILINTIPENEYIFSEMIDNPELTIIDALYHKPYISDSNCKYTSGLEWLAYQAQPAIEKIFYYQYGFDEIFSILSDYKSLKNKIVLTGYMATGKTTIGLKLAEKLGWNFIDVDDEIVKKTGLEISKIFEKYGETYFRELERDIVLNLPKSGKYLIALGGGALSSNDLAEYIKTNFYVIYVYSNLFDIKTRINSENSTIRPLANFANIDELYKSREETYFNTSDLIIYNCNDLSSTINLLSNEIRSTF